MTLQPRAPRRVLFNVIEVVLLVLIVASWVRVFTIPSSASMVKVTREANHLDCRPDGTLDINGAVHTAMTRGKCEFSTAESPASLSLLVVILASVVLAVVLFGVLSRLGKTRDALFRPWLRLVLLALLAVSLYPAVRISSAASAVATEQEKLTASLQASCTAAQSEMTSVTAQVDKQCRALGFATLKDCLAERANGEGYAKAQAGAIIKALKDHGLAIAPKCDLPPDSTAEKMRNTVGITGPEAQASTREDRKQPPSDGGITSPIDGGPTLTYDDGGTPTYDDPGGTETNVGCSAKNCEAPAHCESNVCKAPAPTDKPARHNSNLKVQAALLIAALGLAPLAALFLVTGAGDSEDSVVSGDKVYDTAEGLKRDPKNPEASRTIARGIRRTGRYKDGLELVREEERRRLVEEIKCLTEIKGLKPGPTGIVAGCAVETVDALESFFSTSATCKRVGEDINAARELRQWVAKCICKGPLGDSVNREIECVLPKL